ncbi:hypothetical protein Poli38472_012989 [Pythium oligandrum]|uniref:Transmembrane protein n=1 Tax=Pythium oligandrum TaxID=41045 RepID=A0A8K1FM05_PYTOL|nr:hypothetical protein Poli38472_012989 [Pythium oligandrum]|eukprot:TMW64367.1 hypothetical protein Poli38472_012989 [Pythium oligandrum]
MMTGTRARSAYQRLPQGDVGVATSPADANPHVGNFEDDETDGEDAMDEVDRDTGSDGESDALKKRMKTRSLQAAAWSTKMHALLWILAAASVAYAIDFFHVIFNDPRIKTGFFQVGLVCFGVNLCITCYLAIYLPYIKRITLEWSVYCPRMIPTATIVGVVASFCFVCAFWPVWGLLTPGLLLLFFIGSLMTAHFLPSI